MQIYLAGPIRHSPDPYTWRNAFEETHPEHKFLNPLDFDVNENADGSAPSEDVVDKDLYHLYHKADALICKWEKVETAGTPMELVYADEIYEIPVVVWNSTDEELSPWVKDHADAVVDMPDDAINILEAGYSMTRKVE